MDKCLSARKCHFDFQLRLHYSECPMSVNKRTENKCVIIKCLSKLRNFNWITAFRMRHFMSFLLIVSQ